MNAKALCWRVGTAFGLALLIWVIALQAISAKGNFAAPPLPRAIPTLVAQTDVDLFTAPPLDPTKYQITTQTRTSPNGQWTAEVLVALPVDNGSATMHDYYQQLTVVRTDGSQQFAPIRVWSPYGLGWDAPQLAHWSRDSQSLYFTIAGLTDGCGIFNSGSNLQRFDLSENTITRVLFGDRWATFSPDEQRVAYFGYSGLVVHDLATRIEEQTDRDLNWPTPGGHIIWSPDGSRIAYTVANSPCLHGWADSTTLVIVDATTMTETELLPNDKRRLVTVQWLAEDALLVIDLDTGNYAAVNIGSGEVKAVGESSVVAELGEWTLHANTELGGLTAQHNNGAMIRELLPPGEYVGATLTSPTTRYLLVWHGMNSASALADGLPLSLFNGETGTLTAVASTALYNKQYFSWSPDGSQFTFTAGGQREAQANKWLNIFDVATGAVTTVISQSSQIPGMVTWSPSGEWIAYAAIDASAASTDPLMTLDNPAIAARRIWLLNPQTGEYRRLNAVDDFQDAPIWSDDGAMLYYVQREGDEVMLVATDLRTGAHVTIDASRQLAPDSVGYYGQGEWAAVQAFRPK